MDEARLRVLPLFSHLSKEEIRDLSRHTDEVDVSEGEHLIDEGRGSYEFFVIEEGTAEVLLADMHLANLGPGDFFGEIGLLADDRRRTASVVARSPMKVAVMAGHDFRHVEREMPHVATEIRDAIARRTRELSESGA